MHKLTKFRHTEDLTMLQTAELLGVSEGIISYWESGRRTPRLYHIRAIERLTDGAVTANDWELQPDKSEQLRDRHRLHHGNGAGLIINHKRK